MPLIPITAPVPEIIVSAAREPGPLALSGVAASIIDLGTIQALALPQATDYLRFTPSAAVAVSGGLGQQTQVRLRGAEANHTLVFVDGIPSNDPASSSEFLFQTLPAEGLARIEVLRGPQSALWGSEAIGGVVSVTTLAPAVGIGGGARAEGGSLGTYRFSGNAQAGGATAGVSLLAAYQATDGIDVAGAPAGDPDGFKSLLLSAKATAAVTPWLDAGAVARWSDSTTRYDGFDFLTARPADEPLATTNTLVALRGYLEAKALGDRWRTRAEVTFTDSANRNRDGGAFANRTDGDRLRLVGQTSLTFGAGGLQQRITGAVEYRDERFRSRSIDPSDLANQRAARDQLSGVGEYRIELAHRAAVSVSVRHDANSGFRDATTVRAAGAAQLGGGFGLHASYGEGVANPTFIEQFGFFPSSFIGNPNLRPERARSWDAGAGWARGGTRLDVTVFAADLKREIVSTFDFANFQSSVANAEGASQRRGVEATARLKPASWLTLDASYAYVDAETPRLADGLRPREVRRPEHSGSVSVVAERGRGLLALSAAVVGARQDLDFASFPAAQVRLGQYALASVSGRYRLSRRFALDGRIENAFDERYEDVLGYRTPGLTAYGGVKASW